MPVQKKNVLSKPSKNVQGLPEAILKSNVRIGKICGFRAPDLLPGRPNPLKWLGQVRCFYMCGENILAMLILM